MTLGSGVAEAVCRRLELVGDLTYSEQQKAVSGCNYTLSAVGSFQKSIMANAVR